MLGQEKLTKTKEKKKSDLVPAQNETVAPDTANLLDRIDDAIGNVRITHGANDGEFQVVGKTVASVRRSLKTAYNIPDDAQSLIKGKPVSEDYVLKSSDNLEFVKAAGVKGALLMS